MEDFTIDIVLGGKEYSFEMRLVATGYMHKFHVSIEEVEVVFEPDEERKFRAIVSEADRSKVKDRTTKLIAAVGEKLESLR